MPSRPVAHGSSGGCKYFPGLRGGQQRARPLMLQEQHPTDPGHRFHSAHCHLPQWDRHSPHNNKITGTASGEELSVRMRMIETFVNSQNSTFRWQRLSFSKQIEKNLLLSIDLIHFKENDYSLGSKHWMISHQMYSFYPQYFFTWISKLHSFLIDLSVNSFTNTICTIFRSWLIIGVS